MSEMSHEDLLGVVRAAWEERDPVPDGLVAQMQQLARAESDLLATDWDYELLQLLDRSEELAGARGGSGAFTLRFGHDDIDLLLRIVAEGGTSRIDGWVVPALPMTVQVLAPDGTDRGPTVEVTAAGRFELIGLESGLTRVRLQPHDTDRTTIVTPTFEI
jgi:hypothetical protein